MVRSLPQGSSRGRRYGSRRMPNPAGGPQSTSARRAPRRASAAAGPFLVTGAMLAQAFVGKQRASARVAANVAAMAARFCRRRPGSRTLCSAEDRRQGREREPSRQRKENPPSGPRPPLRVGGRVDEQVRRRAGRSPVTCRIPLSSTSRIHARSSSARGSPARISRGILHRARPPASCSSCNRSRLRRPVDASPDRELLEQQVRCLTEAGCTYRSSWGRGRRPASLDRVDARGMPCGVVVSDRRRGPRPSCQT
jgi:hypothetical protein